MHEEHEAQLRRALAEGVLAPEEADSLRERSRSLECSPLDLLLKWGRISDETFVALGGAPHSEEDKAREKAGAGDPFALEQTVTVGQPAEGLPADRTIVAATPASPESAFPVPGWERFQPLRFLGEGGMGRVFLANDPRLRRHVALKFVRDGGVDASRRTLLEARAQARLNHERVCRVYEVGEVQGRIYIAMQFVDGKPLNALAQELTVEQKVLVFRDVAEGIHEAHRAGLVHRDIKPSNILVERGEDGSLHPYVMDFGLARDWNERLTETGTVLGTPQYMSPEQARGEVSRLDRRTDIYSLGATMYHLFTGQAPISGSNGLEVLSNLSTVEPRPPRSVEPDLSAELEAIILKCLEKDRSHRYDSARALIEDLDRFLSGEPVRARSTGRAYRLRKWLARNRRSVAGSTLAMTVVVAALGQAMMARRDGMERERLARRFTEQVEFIESQSRYSALSPLHDTTPDQKALQTRMESLAAEIQQAGRTAAGPGHYALGRGYLAMEDMPKALEHLETAWNNGYQEPRVAYALALTWSHLYQEHLVEAERVPGLVQREARKRDIERRYREPAMRFLGMSQGAEVPATEFVSSMIAFNEGRYDDALHWLDAIGDRLPWFYEAPKLRGDIFLARAMARTHRGERKEALTDFEKGRAAYSRAATIGESAAGVHKAMADLEHEAMVTELYGQGAVEPAFSRGMEALQNALRVRPDSFGTWVLEARFYRRLAEHRMNKGQEVQDLLEKAVGAARHAADLAPAHPRAHLELGRCHLQWAFFLLGRREDPRGELTEAGRAFEGIPTTERDDQFHSDQGLIFKGWADYEDSIGGDSRAHRKLEIASYQASIQLNPDQPQAWVNLGMAWFTQASHPRNEDVDEDLARAREALEKALSLDPSHPAPYFYAGETVELLAQRERSRGRDARPTFEAALKMYRAGAAIRGDWPHFHNGAGSVLTELATETWARGGTPDALLAEARAAFEQAIQVAPGDGNAYNNVGETWVRQAAYQRARGEDPRQAVLAADDALGKAVKRTPGNASYRANQGWGWLSLAGFELEHKRDPSKHLEQALQVLHHALSLNPGHSRAWLYQGETLELKARWMAQRGQAPDATFSAAEQAFQKAVELAPTQQEVQLAFGHFHRWKASWLRDVGKEDAQAELEQGLSLVTGMLASRPDWAEALLLRASLLEEQARSSSSQSERHSLREQVAEAFQFATLGNPNLVLEWKHQLLLPVTAPVKR